MHHLGTTTEKTLMTTLRKYLTLLSALAIAMAGTVVLAPAPAQAAGSSCVGYYKKAHDIRWAAFAGHRVVATFTTCGYRKYSVPIGPVRPGMRGTSRPRVTLQNRIPFGGGETLRVSTPVYHVQTTATRFRYRFELKQGHVATPRLVNYYAMSIQIRRVSGGKVGRICFVGRACSPWQS